MQQPQKNLSTVEKGLTLDGSVSFKGQLLVNGTVKGTLVGDHVVISEEGVVTADTQASFIIIGGAYKGRLTVTGKLLILSTGICSGIIECQDLEMKPGGLLNGKISCTQTAAIP